MKKTKIAILCTVLAGVMMLIDMAFPNNARSGLIICPNSTVFCEVTVTDTPYGSFKVTSEKGPNDPAVQITGDIQTN